MITSLLENTKIHIFFKCIAQPRTISVKITVPKIEKKKKQPRTKQTNKTKQNTIRTTTIIANGGKTIIFHQLYHPIKTAKDPTIANNNFRYTKHHLPSH